MGKIRLVVLGLVIGLLACGLLLTPVVVKSYQQQQAFDVSLAALGIELSCLNSPGASGG